MTTYTQKVRRINFLNYKYPVKNFLDFVSADGHSQLVTYRYPAYHDVPHKQGKRVKGALVFFHGFGSYVEKFTFAVKPFSDAGYEVSGYDFKGFGHSDGVRGLIGKELDFLRDGFTYVERLHKFYRHEYSEQIVPVIAYGLSLGGTTAVAMQGHFDKAYPGKNLFDAMLLNVPSLGKVNAMDHDQYHLLEDIAEREPERPMLEGIFAEYKKLDYLKDYYDDPLQYGGPVLAQSMLTVSQISIDNQNFASKIRVPLQVILGKEDKIVNNEATMGFFEETMTPPEKKELLEYDGAHYLIMDGWVSEDIQQRQLTFLDKLYSGRKW